MNGKKIKYKKCRKEVLEMRESISKFDTRPPRYLYMKTIYRVKRSLFVQVVRIKKIE